MNFNCTRLASLRLLAPITALILALAGSIPLAQAMPPVITAASPVVLDFDALACDELVQNFYAAAPAARAAAPARTTASPSPPRCE